MRQERWSLDRYRAPFLDVRSIRRIDSALELETPGGRFILSCDDLSAVDEVLLPMLDGLRDPGHDLWRSVCEPSDPDPIRAMLRELDVAGLIRDSAAANVESRQAEIEESVREWSAGLGRELGAAGEEAVLTVERLVPRVVDPQQDVGRLLVEETSFPTLTLLLQARFLRGHAPGVLGLLAEGLRAAARRARGSGGEGWWTGLGAMPSWSGDDWASGLVEPRLVRRYLSAAGDLVRDALAPGAQRRLRAPWREPPRPISGINFILDLEGEVTRLLSELGASPVVAAMERGPLAQRVTRAAFLQEYLVTCRFVDCIAPLLARQFPPPLRDAVHRYFTEEMGHEQLERENCIQLGMTGEQIDAAEPLPLHLAFVDVLTNAARESPLSFFCASMFTEGIIGTHHSLVSLAQQAIPDDPALIAAIGDHAAVNDDADHRGVGRDWMSYVPVVPPATQGEVREWMAYLTELNWRMWDRLVQSCAMAASPEGARPAG